MSNHLRRATWCITTALLLSAGCKSEEGAPFDPRTLGNPEREASAQVQPQEMGPLPTKLENPFIGPNGKAPTTYPTTGPTAMDEDHVRVTLEELIKRTVVSSLEVKIAGYQPAIDETRVTEAEARFDPTYFFEAQYDKTNKDLAFVIAGQGNRNDQSIFTTRTGIRQNLESGGQVEVRAQTGRNEVFTPNSGTDPNPFWDSEVLIQLTQPLLRDFGNEVNRARITINRNNQRISVMDFRKQLEETLFNVEQTYWQLVQATREVEIQQELLNRTIETAIRLVKRFGQDVTRVQVSQANSSVERRRATLVRANARVKDASDRLKQLMNDPEFPVAGKVLLLPGVRPLEEPVHFILQDQIDTALLNRFELGQQQLRVDNAATALVVAKNNLLPQLNVVGQIGYTGLDGQFSDTLDDVFEGHNPNYQAGIQLEIPIGNRAARAVYQRALLQRQQAIDNYRKLIDDVSTEVKTAARDVETTWEEIRRSTAAVFAAADSLQAITDRENAGEPLSPTFLDLKLNQQQELATAQSAQAQSIAGYNIAIARLEQAKGTLLRYNNVMLEQDNLPFTQRVAAGK